MRTIPVILLLTAFFASACSMQQEIEVDLPQHNSVTFIECYLEAGVPARALATQSVSFFDSLEVKPADDLQFTLYRNGEQINLKNEYEVDEFHQTVYNYISSDNIEYDAHAHWELVVHRQEKEIARGSTRFLSKPVIKHINYSLTADSLLAVEVKIEDDPGQENFYRLSIHSQGRKSDDGFKGVWNDNTAANGVLKLSTGYAIKAYSDSVSVSVYHIDREYYDFLHSLQKAYEANYNPFAQPSNIESNLRGEAMGVFTAVAGTTEVIYVKR